MGRKKLYNDDIHFRTTTELKETFFATMNKVGKDKFQNYLLRFCNKLLSSNNVTQNNIASQNKVTTPDNVTQNNEDNVTQNNEDNVTQNNDEVKPHDEDWTQDKISGFLNECEDLQTTNNKRVKNSLRSLKNKKRELSEFEQAKAIQDAVEAVKYSGVNSLFKGGCE